MHTAEFVLVCSLWPLVQPHTICIRQDFMSIDSHDDTVQSLIMSSLKFFSLAKHIRALEPLSAS